MSNRQNRPAGPQRGPLGGGGPMSMPGEKAKNFKQSLRRLMGELAPFKARFILVLALAAASTVFSIFGPKISGKITTELFKSVTGQRADFQYILQIVLLLLGLYGISALFGWLQQFLMADVSQRLVYGLRKKVSEKLSRLPLRYFDTRTHGEILSRVTNDLDTVGNTLQQSITQIISSVATLIGVLAMMLSISPLLTLIMLVTLPLYAVVTGVIAKRSQRYFAGQQKELGELNGHVEEMFTAHQVVKAYGQEGRSVDAFREINGRYREQSWKAQFVSGVIMPLMNFISNLGYVLICMLGGWMVIKRTIELGDVQAFMQYSRQFTQPIVQTANIMNIIQSTVASAERVFEVLDEGEERPDSPVAVTPEGVEGNVRFDHVRFGYKPEVTLMKDLSFDVRKGQTAAIVGPTGAGKTTLVNLLMRFYEIDEGSITVDGTDIRAFTRGGLRSLFGMVLQDTWLFSGTIAENIAYGRDNVTREEVERAARLAQCDHFIRTLPEGYDTVLGEDAGNISQGQRQLLTIARAILSDPDILILDEATSSVDTRTEALIQKAMAALMKGRTSFVIAHRLSTIRDADLILVMNDGDVIETGNHRELLEAGGFYSDLYRSQFAGAKLAEA